MGNFFLYECELGAVMWQGENWAYDKLGNMDVAIKMYLAFKIRNMWWKKNQKLKVLYLYVSTK